MRTLKLISLMLFVVATSAFAGDLTPAQESAQRKLYAYLHEQKFSPSIDTSDNSVCFRSGGVLYWIALEGDSPILYSFQRTAFRVGNGDDAYKRRPAAIAANEVNRKHKAVKLTVDEKKVYIAIQVYAAKTEDFTAVFHKYFSQFQNVHDDFIKAYRSALVSEPKMEPQLPVAPSDLRDIITNVSFRLVDGNGNEMVAYDQPLRSFNAKFIQARLDFGPWREKEEDFLLQIRVTRPDGKPIYLPGKKVSAEMNVTLKKTKKAQSVEFDRFGSNKEGFWKAGEYKVEIIESGDVIYKTTFNIL